MIRSIDDLNESEKEREISFLKDSPWDDMMKGQVWGDRGLLRWRMRKEISGYRSTLGGISDNATDTIDADSVFQKLHDFCVNDMTIEELYNLFALSRDELLGVLKSRYNICSFYTAVFSTVAQQLENFEVTGIGLDAPEHNDNNAEVGFERELKFDVTGRGFCLNVVNKSDDSINESVLRIFLERVISLADPIVLFCSESDERKSSAIRCTEGPSFRSDRRVIRLIIARCWADKLMERYTAFNNKVEEDR